MKSIFGLLVPVLFIAMFLGGCVMQYNVPAPAVRSLKPVPQYQLSDMGKENKQTKRSPRIEEVYCESSSDSPHYWELRDGNKIVCSSPAPLQRRYYGGCGYGCGGYYPYGYGYGGYGYGYGGYYGGYGGFRRW